MPCRNFLPGAVKPPDKTVIWSYMDLPRLVFILMQERLFLARADRFGNLNGVRRCAM
jgi:hypothetical protein